MIGNKLHTLSYLKQVTGTRAQATGVSHVLALAPSDASEMRHVEAKDKFAVFNEQTDMRKWRPSRGWAISSTDDRWLHIPEGYVIVHRAEIAK